MNTDVFLARHARQRGRTYVTVNAGNNNIHVLVKRIQAVIILAASQEGLHVSL